MQERSAASREQILQTAARLFQRQGYHATGLNQIVQESGAPKGSLYYYFPGGKEALAVEAILWTKETLSEKIRRFLEKEPDPVKAIQSMIRFAAQTLGDIESIIPCTISLLSLEMSLSSEPIRAACNAAMEEWSGIYAEKLQAVYGEETARRLGTLLQILIDGAFIRSLTKKDVQPLLQVAEEVPFWIGTPEQREER